MNNTTTQTSHIPLVVADEQREKDIQELCKQVLEAQPIWYQNPNGPDDTTCPFCREITHGIVSDFSDIPHTPGCAYHIAKDLSTNHR